MESVTYTERIVNVAVRTLFRLLARMDVKDLERLPRRGPAILMANHTSNLEGPAYYVFIQPRKATALGKRELWSRWPTRFFMKLWGVIPVARGRVDRTALRAAFKALDRGHFLGIAPEGTRSRTGALRQAHPGVALIATRRPVPVYPVVHWGMRDVLSNLARLRRSRVTFRVGRPFRVRGAGQTGPSATVLREIADEMMYEMARALPPRLRGAYAAIPPQEPKYLVYEG